MLALVVVPPITVGVRKFGRFLRELSHNTQAAAAAAASIAEVCLLFTNLSRQLNNIMQKSVLDNF